jgi:phage-related protein
MANKEELQLIITAKDEASKVLNDVNEQTKTLKDGFKTMAVVGGAVFGTLTLGMKKTTDKAMEYESIQARLAHLLKVTHDATDEEVAVLNDQAKALSKVGVASENSITQTQAQLATFDLMAGTIGTLTPAILDYVVAEKGASASTDDFKQLTNGLAQAMQGNFTSLTATGFVLDDVTKKMISTGTEAERSAAIVSVLNSTYEGFNEMAGETSEGALIRLKNNFETLQQVIGKSLLDSMNKLIDNLREVVARITDWAEKNPELIDNIFKFGTFVSGAALAVGLLGLALPPIIDGFSILLGPVGLVIAAIGFLTFLFFKHKKEIMERLAPAIDYIVELYNNSLKPAFEVLTHIIDLFRESWKNVVLMYEQRLKPALSDLFEALKPLMPFVDTLSKVFGVILLGALLVVAKLIEMSLIVLIEGLTRIIEGATKAVDFFKSGWDSAIETISKVIGWVDKLIERIKSLNVLGGVKSAVSAVSGVLGFGGARADGGPVNTGKSYLVGERGPELFTPNQNGRIIPNSGSNITINITGTFLSEDVAGQLGDQLVNRLTQAGLAL